MAGAYCAGSLSNVARKLDHRFGIKTRWDAAREFALDRPMSALFLATVFASVVVPVAVFLFVVGSSVLVGAATLLCVQGAILIAAITVLLPALTCCVLCAVAVTAFVFVSSSVLRLVAALWRSVAGTARPTFHALASMRPAGFDIRGKVALPSVDYKVIRSTNNCNNDPGDYPLLQTRVVYTATAEDLQNED